MRRNNMHALSIMTSLVLIVFLMGIACAQPASSPLPTTPSTPTQTTTKTFELTCSSFSGPMESMASVAKDYIAEITKRTNGVVKITYYPGGTLTPPPQAYDSMVKGITSMSEIVISYTPGRFPLLQGWYLPIEWTGGPQITRVVNELYNKYKPKETADAKWLMIYGGGSGLFLTKKPVRTLQDVRGSKIRCMGMSADFLKEMGVVPVSMPLTDTYDALQKGIVDGTTNPPATLRDMKLADVVKYASNIMSGGVVFSMSMNLDQWNSLPAEVQKVFQEVSETYTLKEVEAWETSQKTATEWAVKQGVQFINVDPEVTKEWNRAAQVICDKYVADMSTKGLPGKEFLDDMLKLIQKYK
jgi:TRAP-type C4-dicarboxylate transport system substrate-binding protein